MKNKILIFISLLINIIAIILNFPAALMGDIVQNLNIIVTIVYILSWCILVFLGIMIKNIAFFKYTVIYWSASFVTGFISFFFLISKSTMEILIPAILIFATPCYGILGSVKPFIPNYNYVLIIISMIFALLGLVISKKLKVHKEVIR